MYCAGGGGNTQTAAFSIKILSSWAYLTYIFGDTVPLKAFLIRLQIRQGFQSSYLEEDDAGFEYYSMGQAFKWGPAQRPIAQYQILGFGLECIE
jgi:hypothetical protein